MPSPVLALLLAWGAIPWVPAPPPRGDPYLGVIEKVIKRIGNPPRVRVAFKRSPSGEWLPAVGQPSNLEELKAAPNVLPAQIDWTVCRDGRSLGTTTSTREPYPLYADNGTQRLPSPPPFVRSSPYDIRFRVFQDEPMARPVVLSTLPDGCRVGPLRRMSAAAVAPIVERTMAALTHKEGDRARPVKSRGWQAGPWTVVELDYRQSGGWATKVLISVGDAIRHDIDGARVIDWISVDGDEVPDLLLWTTAYNRNGYVLIYGSFSKRTDFSWIYH